MRVTTAERAGSHGPSQDRIFTTPNAVVVLDGASEPEPSEHDGGWLAQVLGEQLAADLMYQPRRDLHATLRDAIATVADRFQLTPGTAPSTTVAIAAWTDAAVRVLVLGDTPVIVTGPHRTILQVRDNRLSELATRRAIVDGSGFGQQQRERWRALVAAERAARNRVGGYWIAEATPEAAGHAIVRHYPRVTVDALLILTDGVANGVDRYGTPADWGAAFAIARQDVQQLVDLVHDTEAGDPDGARWPRSARHDDKAAALITFDR